MSKIVTFGEIMMRLNPRGFLKFVQADEFEASYAGAEANVAVSLANYGNESVFISKIPSHDIGQCAINALRHFGVNTAHIVRGGQRLGIYYVEKGASQRGSRVIYDRAFSAIALASRTDFEWSKILEGVEWFHWTGITPALGGELPQILQDALVECKSKGITVSCDLNYRGKLWTRACAREIMSQLLPYTDVLIANEEDAEDIFGIKAEDTNVVAGTLNLEGYEDVAKKLSNLFSFKAVAITLRGSISASENTWGGLLYRNGITYHSKHYLINIVDRVGGGDSFGGGLIHAMLHDDDPQKMINFAVAASCLKQTIEHDFNLVPVDQILSLVEGDTTGRVKR